MIEVLKLQLAALNGEIEHAELSDMTYTRNFTYLVKQRRIVSKAVRKLEKLEETRYSEEQRIHTSREERK